MLEAAIVVVRLLQYAGAAMLFGTALLLAWAVPRGSGVEAALARPARRWLAAGATVLALGSLMLVGAQASLFAGSFADGLTGEAMGAVAGSMDLGKAALVRAALAGVALALVLAMPSRPGWLAAAMLGALATASLAWLGHAGAGEGWLHLASDIVHLLAAAAWIGALAGFLLLARADRGDPVRATLQRALARFAGIGSLLVALLLASGLVNAWMIVGPAHAFDVWATAYGRVLAAKLAVFAAMLALAANNRWWLTPALTTRPGGAAALRRSVMLEAAAGLAVLALVAWLGTLEPPAG